MIYYSGRRDVMSIIWFNEKPKDCVATITASNITLNKPASNYFVDVYAVMLGIDKSDGEILIKPIDRTTIENKSISKADYYKITIKSSYGRVTNKAFIELISSEFNLQIENPQKFSACWDEKEKLLRIKIMEVIK